MNGLNTANTIKIVNYLKDKHHDTRNKRQKHKELRAQGWADEQIKAAFLNWGYKNDDLILMMLLLWMKR